MTRPLIQIGDEVREMTDGEFAQWEADNEAFVEAKTAEAAALKAATDAAKSARAKLTALGLTEAEIKALVG